MFAGNIFGENVPVRWRAPPLDPHENKTSKRVNRKRRRGRTRWEEERVRSGGRVATGFAAFGDPGMPGIQKQ